MLTISLTQNIAMLVSLSLIHGLLMRRVRRRDWKYSVIFGVLSGLVAVLGMMVPVVWAPGVIFDGRSIVLGIAGMFGGPLAVTIAAGLAAVYRISLGGAGMWMGVSVIAASSLIGAAAYRLRPRHPRITNLSPLLGIGLLIHLVMFALMGLLPDHHSRELIWQLAAPLLLLYPPAFMLAGKLFAELESHFLTAKALRESESRNRALLDAIPDMIFMLSDDGRILDYQAADASHLYTEPQQFLGRNMRDVLPAEVAELNMDRLAEAKRTGRMVLYEYDLETAGMMRRYECRLAPGGVGDFIAIVRDVSERDAALRALRESRALYQDLIASTLAGIYRIRERLDLPAEADGMPHLEVDFVSDRLCELVGRSREEIIASPHEFHRRIHPDDLPSWLESNQDAFRREVPFSWNGRVMTDEGERWVHFESRPRRVSATERIWTGVVVDIHDRVLAVNERQEMERRMLHVQKLESLGVLAGGMAHDFSNIVMAILGHADMALDSLPRDATARGHLDAIRTASQRAADLSRLMLAYSGKGRFVIEPLDLTELVREMAHLLSSAISKKAVLKLDLAEDLPIVEGDAAQIRQVVMNLITNASDAIGDKCGEIRIATGRARPENGNPEVFTTHDPLSEGNHVFLEVSDTGCGMDEETRQRIFEPFFTTKFTGRGLGMAAVEGIVRGHKGAVRIRSRIGEGSTFRVFLPAADDAPRPAKPAESRPWSGTGKVLLADDEEPLRVLGSLMLERLGFEVETATDGREALALFRDRQGGFDLVLLDLTMPHMDGEETFRELRKLDPGVRVILCSGYSGQDVTARLAGSGLAGFIQKPFTLADLAGKLQAGMARG